VESAGIRDILTKSIGSPNAINVVRATILGLTQLKDPALEIAKRKGTGQS
jgi:small subunit ribosomal protein S5